MDEMRRIEEATDSEERYGNFLYTCPLLRHKESRESCDDELAGALAIRQHEGDALEHVGEHLHYEYAGGVAEVQQYFAILDMDVVVLIQCYLYRLISGIASNIIVNPLTQLAWKAQDTGFWLDHVWHALGR
jgi:hypothetical protein